MHIYSKYQAALVYTFNLFLKGIDNNYAVKKNREKFTEIEKLSDIWKKLIENCDELKSFFIKKLMQVIKPKRHTKK